jgi:hypothetical protein
MTDAQNGSGDDTEGNGSNPEVVRMWQKLYQMPGGKKDPFEDTIARMPDGIIRAGTSPDTGRPMYTTPEDSPLTCTFNDAVKYAEQLNAQKLLGHDDWRMPTKAELNVLFMNRAAIGSFNETGSHFAGWYWLSSPVNWGGVWGQRFSDGNLLGGFKNAGLSLRCVRG